MSKYTREDIYKIIEEEDVEFIRLQFTDMFGHFKNMAVTTSQLEKVLNNKILIDGSLIQGFIRIEEADMYLYPDLDTFEIFPWRPQQGKVARFICDVYKIDGTPFEGDPRYILKNVINQANEMGYDFFVGPECEFFLFHSDDNGQPTTLSHERGGYFDMGPIDLGENARREIVLTLEDMGFEIESSYHEIAPAQHEIDFKYAQALKAADDIMTFKLVVRTIAKRHGLHATFMPKPKYGENGSGMHVNMSLSTKDGKNIFNDQSDKLGLSKEAYYFMAGIMQHIKGMTAITNPIVNSYKRLVSGYEAPFYISWSAVNKNQLFRIPIERGNNTRIELRSPDSASNPYLVLAICLAAGLDGIKNKLNPPESINKNLINMKDNEIEQLKIDKLPLSLKSALNEFENDKFIKNVLGERFMQKYIKVKNAEIDEYRSQITQWELDNYLYKY